MFYLKKILKYYKYKSTIFNLVGIRRLCRSQYSFYDVCMQCDMGFYCCEIKMLCMNFNFATGEKAAVNLATGILDVNCIYWSIFSIGIVKTPKSCRFSRTSISHSVSATWFESYNASDTEVENKWMRWLPRRPNRKQKGLNYKDK